MVMLELQTWSYFSILPFQCECVAPTIKMGLCFLPTLCDLLGPKQCGRCDCPGCEPRPFFRISASAMKTSPGQPAGGWQNTRERAGAAAGGQPSTGYAAEATWDQPNHDSLRHESRPTGGRPSLVAQISKPTSWPWIHEQKRTFTVVCCWGSVTALLWLNS